MDVLSEKERHKINREIVQCSLIPIGMFHVNCQVYVDDTADTCTAAPAL